MKTRSSNRIAKYRAHNSVVNRMTRANSSSAVTPVDRVEPVSNNPALVSYNSLMASDQFYDNLADLQEEYRKFYHDQQELEKALDNMEQDKECLCDNMKELVEKYNLALNSLKKFDEQFGTNHRESIENLLGEFKKSLLNVGVTITENAILEFDEMSFRESVRESNDALKFLFRPIKGLIINLHRAFQNIEIPEDEAFNYGNDGMNFNGMITDEEI